MSSASPPSIPSATTCLFERFVSEERREPPDIDVDFEHERREIVMQWVFETYGRDHAALCSTVIRYRAKGALRDVGKALGLPEDLTKMLSSQIWGWSKELDPKQARDLNLNLGDRRLRLALELARDLIGAPRHLSQHPGGFVLTHDRLDELVPIEPAAMADRQVIEWDKDDIDVLRFMKVDCLALGMLSCMKRGFDLLAEHKGIALDLATIPAEDPRTYAMIRKADTLGTFQIESRAQMSMLPRIKPRTFYDLVIEVAIVRPGPIQGDMVHPYLRRREGKEKARLSQARTGARARQDIGRAAVSGTGHARRDRMRGLHARGGRPASPRHGDLQAHRRRLEIRRKAHLRHGGERLREGFCENGLSSSLRGSAATAFRKAMPPRSR